MVPMAGGGGSGCDAVAGVLYFWIMAWVGRAEKVIFRRLEVGCESLEDFGGRGEISAGLGSGGCTLALHRRWCSSS